MAERGFAIIHSVKDYGDYKEDDVRSFFKGLRDKARSPSIRNDSALENVRALV